MPVSIRYSIPLLLVMFTAILTAYTVQREWGATGAYIRGQAVADMLERMALLQKQFSYTVSDSAHEGITQGMSLLSSEPDPQIAMLANNQAIVLSATNETWIGQSLTQIAREQWPEWSGEPLAEIIDRVQTQFTGELFLVAAGRYILSIYPVTLSNPADSPATKEQIGVLVVQRDLSRQLAYARRIIKEQWVEIISVLAGLTVVLWILIHLLVTRRLNTLLSVTQRFATGNLGVRSQVRGKDEVAILSQSFNHMAEQVADIQRQLEDRVQQRTRELAETISKLQKEITERQRAEKKLFGEKERIRVTLESIGDAVVTTDLVGTVDYLNPSAERLTGWSKEEAAYQALYQVFNVIDDNSRDPIMDPIQRCFQQGQIVGLASNTLLICRNGQERSIDYSAAPIHDQEGARVGAVLVFRDVTEARRAAHQLSYHASHDALTGLINRREFERRLEHILATSAPEEPHAVVYLDLDQFKVVNDTCGHIAGDAVLRQVSGVLAAQVRKHDTVARLGGDEFAVLLEYCQQEQMLRIAHKVHEALQDFRFVWQNQSFTIGASIGLVPIEVGLDTLASVFRSADIACYTAKEQGRNRVHVYKRDDQELAQRYGEMQWVLRIQEALTENRFVLFYQPIVPLDQSDQPHVEVLLRLLNRDGSIVPPGAFIPAAERYNQMQGLDRWVIRSVFANLQDLATFSPATCVAINISGQSLGDQHFLEFIEELIAEKAAPIERICFEITETAAISNLGHAMRFFSALKPRGCRFALDDFGSGLSSFAYLKSLPVDFLKIDGSFVKDMTQDPIDHAMVEAIHRIGHVMGIKTIAERVENPNILSQLKKIGVNYAQGYELGKPKALESDLVCR